MQSELVMFWTENHYSLILFAKSQKINASKCLNLSNRQKLTKTGSGIGWQEGEKIICLLLNKFNDHSIITFVCLVVIQ